MSEVVTVRYDEGQARIAIGGRSLVVDRRDDEDRTSACPVELVASALGS